MSSFSVKESEFRKLVRQVVNEVVAEAAVVEKCDTCKLEVYECDCEDCDCSSCKAKDVLFESRILDDLDELTPESLMYDRLAWAVYVGWPDKQIDTDWNKVVDLYVRRMGKNLNQEVDKKKLLDKVYELQSSLKDEHGT